MAAVCSRAGVTLYFDLTYVLLLESAETGLKRSNTEVFLFVVFDISALCASNAVNTLTQTQKGHKRTDRESVHL